MPCCTAGHGSTIIQSQLRPCVSSYVILQIGLNLWRVRETRTEQASIYVFVPWKEKLFFGQFCFWSFFPAAILSPFYNCQISWVTPISFAIVFCVLQSEVTEQQRPGEYTSANVTFQWKLPVSYSEPLWWIELLSGAPDCVLICSTCSLWRLQGRAARSIKQT